MSYIILTRNWSSKAVFAIVASDEGDIKEYETEEEAEEFAACSEMLNAWGYEIIEISV